MCGLCGFATHRKIFNSKTPHETIASMITLQTHRGPDSEGTAVIEKESLVIGLGHRRLSIIDLSPLGNQPMANENGAVQVVFNGEIYNYKDLVTHLESKGHVFRSRSDTEAIIHAYEEFGVECVKHFDGMFAFALWDQTAGELFIARDRVGIKPLFYAQTPDGLLFSSEMKSLFAFPFEKQIDPQALDSYMSFGYIQAPRTIYKGIFQLPPAHYLHWKNNSLSVKQYWTLSPTPLSGKSNIDTLTDELDFLLTNSVKSHLIADVPVGAFLSGGLDSSLVCAIASKVLKTPLQTFTIGFDGGGDERGYARIVADHIHSQHTEEIVSADLVSKLPSLIWHLEQPLFDNSVMPTFLVSALARKQCKVVLAGDGGDEPFAGYSWTRAATAWPFGISGKPPVSWEWAYRTGKIGSFKKYFHSLTHSPIDRLLRMTTIATSFRNWIYTPEFRSQLVDDPLQIRKSQIEQIECTDKRDKCTINDFNWYLPDDVLCKVDRMSMANSLEVRVPLLDHNVLSWAFSLPWKYRCNGMKGKILLRKVASRYLPEPILKPRKQGFTVPINRWLLGELGDTALKMFASESFRSHSLIDPSRAQKLVTMHRSGKYNLSHRIWSIMILETWCKVWIDNQSYKQSFTELLNEK